MALWAVIAAAAEGFDVGFLGGRVEAFLGEGSHAVASLSLVSISW